MISRKTGRCSRRALRSDWDHCGAGWKSSGQARRQQECRGSVRPEFQAGGQDRWMAAIIAGISGADARILLGYGRRRAR